VRNYKKFILPASVILISIGLVGYLYPLRGIEVTSRPITDPPPRVVRVLIKDDMPAPAEVSLTLGDGVMWQNAGKTPVIVSGGDYFSSGIVPPGGDYSFQFLRAGDYTVAIGDISQRITVASKGNK